VVEEVRKDYQDQRATLVSQDQLDRQARLGLLVLKVRVDSRDHQVHRVLMGKTVYQVHPVSVVQLANQDLQDLREFLALLVLQDHLENLVNQAKLVHLAIRELRARSVYQVNKERKDRQVQLA